MPCPTRIARISTSTVVDPVHLFINQVILESGDTHSKTTKILFQSRNRRHIIILYISEYKQSY